uniref:hypothetical protein n=1 Tax=Burkholderia anthina TaxID=179879 RepID=UPI0015896235|nr:hypothetical protein [Burkholderia anthina]
MAFALGAAILAYPARVVEREICRGSERRAARAADSAVRTADRSGRSRRAGIVFGGLSTGPSISYYSARAERRAPVAIGHVNACRRMMRR